MRIFAHKGLWGNAKEANTLDAIKRAFEAGFDIETDICIQNGNFVIKHDPPLKNEVLLELKDVLTLLRKYNKTHIALHFKHDDSGKSCPSKKIVDFIVPFANQVFLFDISPNCCRELKEMNKNIKIGVSVGDKKYHDRFCDLEEALRSDSIDIIWADEYRNLYSKDFLDTCHGHGKIIYCISPDLAEAVGHPKAKDGYQETWNNLIRWRADGICTDCPFELREFMKVCK